MWFLWIISVFAAFGSSNFLYHGIKKKQSIFVYYGISLFFLGLASVALAIDDNTQSINIDNKTDWIIRFANFSAHVVYLCGLAVLIRTIKPPYARFPVAFVNIPLILLVAFPLAVQTPIIIEWVETILQIGGIVTFTILLVILSKLHQYYVRLFIPTIFFLGSFISFQLELESYLEHLWRLLFAVGLLTFLYFYDRIIHKDDTLFTENTHLIYTKDQQIL